MAKFALNGKFLSQKMTGVQRYAKELIKHLDALDIEDDFIVLAVPPSVRDVPSFRHIKVEQVGTREGVPWEQVDFPKYCRKMNLIPVNLCNAGPLFLPGIVCIHDVKVKVFPRFFTWKFRLWYDFMMKKETKKAKKILTVSNFSKREIIKYYHVPSHKIVVIPDAWQQFKGVQASGDALERHGVREKGYYFTLGSLEPNKNLAWIASEAKANPNETFLVSGRIDANVFSRRNGISFPENVRLIGFASDADVKALMTSARALLFPSIYEGFGLPPIECLSVGTPAIVSDIPVLREIYGDAVAYINPEKDDYKLRGMEFFDKGKALRVLESYSWEKSADLLYETLRREVSL